MTVQTLAKYLSSLTRTQNVHNGILAIFQDCINDLGHDIKIMKAEIEAVKKEVQFLRSEVLKRVKHG